ncbi:MULTISPECIES: M16 family metallopeptidase [Methylobacterium]|uniref:Zinc protease n=1 Tax=Methylobacterium bullatum TaxID=570505 RepID=A0A679JN66_9HYPH|nr:MULTISPECIES: pitrilysin family protein [Methylobacterium]KQO43143.1 zinc protease [Methylobacterium sp. Leaf85]KQP46873.1 zinc protease [Methylobacterium sp. Leaf106]MBD8903745.1 peptidase M16 [Methylobacterium bullatum]TXN28684.1 insulinase family protein [Methylobacterium sp. WL19]CAA2138041.1 putative zinc protease [Methylobacterium bullatum]
MHLLRKDTPGFSLNRRYGHAGRAEAAPFGRSEAGGPEVSAFALDNGLDVVVVPDHRAPVVTHMVWYRNGSADDPIGQSGIAHFLEHLMFKGTEKHPVGAFSQAVSGLGGQENAFTSYDYTAYFQRVARDHLKTMMEFEADRMTGLVLEDAVVAPERDVVLEERRMRVETDPSAQLSEAMAASLFVHHPYGTPIIGWMHEIEDLNRTHALDYYNRFYTPENAILVVAGDVTPDEVRRLADDTYGLVTPRGARPVRVRAKEPEPRALRRLSVVDPKVEQPTLQRLYLTPSCMTARDGECHALELLAEVMGGGSTSFLYRKLVMELGVAVNAGAWYMGSAIDDTRFSVYAIPAEGVSLERLEDEVDRVLRRVPSEALGPEAIERAKTRLVAETVYSSDSQSSLARIYGSALAIGESIEEVRRWPSDIEGVTRDRLAAVAERYLIPARSVTGYLTKTRDPDAAVA